MSANAGNARETYIHRLQKEYGITAVQAHTQGLFFLFDAERKEMVVHVPDYRIKEIGAGRTNHGYGLRLSASEVVQFAKELQDVFKQWFIDLPEYNGITVEEAMGFRHSNKGKKGREENEE